MSKIFICIGSANSFDAILEYAKEHRYNLEVSNKIFCEPRILDTNWRELVKDYQQKLHGFKGAISVHGAHYDLVYTEQKREEELRKLAIHSEDKKVREVSRQKIFQSIEIVRELKAKRVVFHGDFNPLVRGERYKPNWIERDVIFWSEVVEKYPSIEVVLENTMEPRPEIFRTVLDEVNSSRLKICLDIGHVSVWAEVPVEEWIAVFEEWIAVLGEDIRSIHTHDSSGYVDHLIPGKGAINWQEFSDLIAKYQIDPDIVFEVNPLETTIQSLKYFREENIYPFNK